MHDLPLPDKVSHCGVKLQKYNLPSKEECLGHLGRVLGALEVVNHFLQLLQLRPWKTDDISVGSGDIQAATASLTSHHFTSEANFVSKCISFVCEHTNYVLQDQQSLMF